MSCAVPGCFSRDNIDNTRKRLEFRFTRKLFSKKTNRRSVLVTVKKLHVVLDTAVIKL